MGQRMDKDRIAKMYPLWLRLALCAAFILIVALGIRQLWKDPNVILLVPEGGAQWIRYSEPFGLNAWLPERRATDFRCRFQADPIPPEAVLTLHLLRGGTVRLNGRSLAGAPSDPKRWKEPARLDLRPGLVKGINELHVAVVNENGPPAVLAHCEPLGILSGREWEAREGDRPWRAALPVDEISPYPLSRTFPRADQALISLLPFFAPLFALVFFCSLKWNDCPVWMASARLSPGTVRWLLLGGWFVMGINNFWKIPIPFGMDFPGHTQYISYVATSWRVPLATEGWQMFQPPLFYYLEALLFRSFLLLFDPDTVIRVLKLLPFLCGALQVEICYRALRYAYPEGGSPQVLGTLLGGLLPMNLYLSQSIGNEPLAGVLTALVVLGACRILSGQTRTGQPYRESLIVTGFVLGLALLTKPTPILIIPPLIFFVSVTLYREAGMRLQALLSAGRAALLLLGTAFLTAGWYYLRNYVEIGQFFIGGWDSSRKIIWWMDPGYRTLRQCYAFGEALSYPVFSAIFGFWDGLYSTFWLDGFLSSLVSGRHLPWNQGFMISSALLSLPPTAAIVIGAAAALFGCKEEPQRRILQFAVTCVLVYLAAILYVFLIAPILTSVKASYALGLIPCFALLAAKGFEVMTSHRIVRAVLYGLFACWVMAAYGAYFVI